MRIAVCVKQIPDPATPYELDAESHLVVRTQDQVLDDTDRYGVEVGLQLAEANEGTVTLFSMSPIGLASRHPPSPRHGCRQGGGHRR